VAPTLSASRSFDPLRSDSRFQAILAEAEVGRQQALTAFREAGGERLSAGDANSPSSDLRSESLDC
jgi:hypothetical protein